MNNKEREMWITNDEGLYRWWKSSRVSITKFIRENRKDLDQIIDMALHQKPKEATWRDYV